MSTKHSLEQILNISKDIFKTCSLNDALFEFTANNKLGSTLFIQNFQLFIVVLFFIIFLVLVVNSQWSQIDLEKNERTKFQKYHLFEIKSNGKHTGLNQLHVGKPQHCQNK